MLFFRVFCSCWFRAWVGFSVFVSVLACFVGGCALFVRGGCVWWLVALAVGSLVVSVVSVVLRVVAVFLRRRLFARFPRPRFVPSSGLSAWREVRFAVPSVARRAGVGWFCCPLSALPSVRRRCCVCSVLPAVVSRRSGVLLFVWVFSSGFAPSGG